MKIIQKIIDPEGTATETQMEVYRQLIDRWPKHPQEQDMRRVRELQNKKKVERDFLAEFNDEEEQDYGNQDDIEEKK